MYEVLKDMITDKGYEVIENTVFKGSAEMIAWQIRKGDGNIAPTIYPEMFENINEWDACDRIIEMVENAPKMEFDKDLLKWKNIKDKVFLGIRRELPKDENTITKKILDMELTVKIPVEEMNSEYGMATVTLNKNVLAFIQENEPDLTVDEIFETAKRNTVYCGPTGLPDFILETLNIITATNNMFGASVFGNTDYLAEYCTNKGYSEMYILPSSIHEVLCMFPEKDDLDPDALRTMVREVNATEVLPQEQLSDNVYYFNANTKELRIA